MFKSKEIPCKVLCWWITSKHLLNFGYTLNEYRYHYLLMCFMFFCLSQDACGHDLEISDLKEKVDKYNKIVQVSFMSLSFHVCYEWKFEMYKMHGMCCLIEYIVYEIVRKCICVCMFQSTDIVSWILYRSDD